MISLCDASQVKLFFLQKKPYYCKSYSIMLCRMIFHGKKKKIVVFWRERIRSAGTS